MRQTRETSILSYHNMLRLGEDQQTVLIAIHAYPDSTDRELAQKLGYADPNRLRPRRFELAEQDLVFCSGTKVCSISKKKAMTWRVRRNE